MSHDIRRAQLALGTTGSLNSGRLLNTLYGALPVVVVRLRP